MTFSVSHSLTSLALLLGVIIDGFLVLIFLNPCTVHFVIYKVLTPTNALFIKLDNVLNFTLKITLTCSYIF